MHKTIYKMTERQLQRHIKALGLDINLSPEKARRIIAETIEKGENYE